jgi:predicted adenylyl cyclase CyaB
VIEVELKAHVRDRAAVLAAVSSFALAEGEVDKSDEYWHGPDWRLHRGAKGFRVRTEGDASVVTFKTKRSEGGIEINREREFSISDAEAFTEFVERLGCEPFYQKRKHGRKFRAGGSASDPDTATIEILEVVGLGDFIEIEILLPNEEPAAIALAQGEIRSLLARSGVREEDIESRFYSELLIAAGLVKTSL